MPEDDAQRRATEFVKDLYAAGDIDATTNIGRIHLRHPGAPRRARRPRR